MASGAAEGGKLGKGAALAATAAKTAKDVSKSAAMIASGNVVAGSLGLLKNPVVRKVIAGAVVVGLFAGFLVVSMVVSSVTGAITGARGGGLEEQSRDAVTEAMGDSQVVDHLDAIQEIGTATGVDWQMLAAIATRSRPGEDLEANVFGLVDPPLSEDELADPAASAHFTAQALTDAVAAVSGKSVSEVSMMRGIVADDARPGEAAVALPATDNIDDVWKVDQELAENAEMVRDVWIDALRHEAAHLELSAFAAATVFERAQAWMLGEANPVNPDACSVVAPSVQVPLGEAQEANARTIIDTALADGGDPRDAVIAIMVAMDETEPGPRNLASRAMPESMNYPHDAVAAGDHDSVGLFQQRTSTGWGSIGEIMDPVKSTQAFLGIAEHTNNPGLRSANLSLAGTNIPGGGRVRVNETDDSRFTTFWPWVVAQAVQRSYATGNHGDQIGSNYREFFEDAVAIVSDMTGAQIVIEEDPSDPQGAFMRLTGEMCFPGSGNLEINSDFSAQFTELSSLGGTDRRVLQRLSPTGRAHAPEWNARIVPVDPELIRSNNPRCPALIHVDALPHIEAWARAFRDHFGHPMRVAGCMSTFRTAAQQASIENSPLAAAQGLSFHEWGLAIDFSGFPFPFGASASNPNWHSALYAWLADTGPSFGFVHPCSMRPVVPPGSWRSPISYWHFEFAGDAAVTQNCAWRAPGSRF